MPNWSYNHHAIKGHKNAILKLLNDAIANSVKFRNEFGEPVTVKPQVWVDKAFDLFLEIGCSLVSSHIYGEEPKKDNPVVDKKIRLGTFRPIPLTFLYYDTTNHADKFPEAAKEQHEKYGVIGWYDYGNEFNSTKWDNELRDFKIHIDGDIVTINFASDTAWSSPDGWCQWLKEEYPELAVFICSAEESGAFYFYQEVGSEPIDWTEEINGRLENFANEHEDDDDYYDKRFEIEDEAIDEMLDEFYMYVSGWEL